MRAADDAGEAPTDFEAALRGVADMRRLADRLEFLHVAGARRAGWSWDRIAKALGVTRQAVHKKHSGRRGT